MSKKSLIVDNLNRAFIAYIGAGGDLQHTRKLLKADGLDFTVKTLSAWELKYNWKERKEQADAITTLSVMAETDLTGTRKKMFMALISEASLYIQFMVCNKTIDPQVTYAYCALVKTIENIATKFTPKETDEERQKKITEALHECYGAFGIKDNNNA